MQSVAPRPSIIDVLLLGATLGLALGLVEIGALSIKKFAFGRYLHLNPQIAWLGPSFYALAFAGIGVVVWLAGRRASATTVVRLIVFLSVTLGASGVLFIINGLHTAAVLLLGLGIGAHAAMQVAPRWERLRPRLPRAFAACITVVVLLGLLINADLLTGGDERSESARAGAPNILWIIWDTVRAENLSLYGYTRPTSPTLEALARRGVVFDHAVSPAPWTLPAHASMFTGLPTDRLNADWRQPFGRGPATVAEIARDNGYRTGGFVANLFYASRESGLARGFSTYRDYPRASLPEFLRSTSLARSSGLVSAGAGQLLRRIRGPGAPSGNLAGAEAGTGNLGSPELDDGDGVRPAAQGRASPPRGVRGWISQMRNDARVWAPKINEQFLDWIGEAEGQRPFFAFLNYFDPHDPYVPPPPFDTLFSGGGLPDVVMMAEGKRYTAREVEALIARYDESIAYTDHHLAMLLDRLDSLGMLENTIVVVSSDHGEEFGEHGVFTHGHSMYQPALRVPLVIAFPGKVPQGHRVDRWVTTSDLAATVLSLAEIPNERIHGKSLERWWTAQSSSADAPSDTLSSRVSYSWAVPDYYPISKGDMETVFADPYKYILNGDGREELYDLREDPGEARDLAAATEAESILPLLRQRAGATRDR